MAHICYKLRVHFSVRAWPPTELQKNYACVTYDPVGARRRENLDLSNTFLMNYFVDFLHDLQSFSFQRRFICLRGIAFSRPYR